MNDSNPSQRWGSNSRKDSKAGGRDIILAAAISCYFNKGVALTTISDIADEAKITRRTIYRYFPNKQEVIKAVIEYQASEFFEEMSTAMANFSGNFAERLKACILFTITNGPRAQGQNLVQGEYNAALSSRHYFSSDTVYQQWHAILGEYFEEALSNGEINTPLDFSTIMSWCGRMIYSYIQFPEDIEVIEKNIDFFIIRNLHNGAV